MQAHNQYCKPTNKTSFVSCGSTALEKCRDCGNNMCSSIQCGKEVEKPVDYIDQFVIYNELCIPRNISDKKKKSMCKNFHGVNSYRVFYSCDYNIKYSFSFITSEFYMILVLIILGLTSIIVYYNNYLIKKKQKPFNLPLRFLETLFPNDNNINNEYQQMKSEDKFGGITASNKYNNI